MFSNGSKKWGFFLFISPHIFQLKLPLLKNADSISWKLSACWFCQAMSASEGSLKKKSLHASFHLFQNKMVSCQLKNKDSFYNSSVLSKFEI